MTSRELKDKFLSFFEKRGHRIIPSSSLVPENDPTVLFTTAGMHPLVPYLLGEKHPEGRRLVNIQKCLRTTDIEDVGDNRHLTFFEMLGNWSLGDYFKKEAIEWSWEFLTNPKWLGLEPERIYVTVFKGDETNPIDKESIKIWQEQFKKAGILAQVCEFGKPIFGNSNLRIFPLSIKDNWWGPAGEKGPCGPCTEIFYDVSSEEKVLEKSFQEEVDNFRIIEIWNNVFMEFNKVGPEKFEKLSQKNVDTGMGLERTLAILSGKKDVFESNVFYPIFEEIEKISGRKYQENETVKKSMRIIADHLKAAIFLLAEGLQPSNLERGYVLRRLIRRAVRYGMALKINKDSSRHIAETIIEIYKNDYPELIKNKNLIFEELAKEEERFLETLEKGLKEFNKINRKKISGKEAFDLYQSYGFPFEITRELVEERGLEIDEQEFKEEMKKHQDLSRTVSAGMFKGGLADDSQVAKKLHTAAHLMLEAMRKILGNDVQQKGSNITRERLRFDFSCREKLSQEQIKKIENMVNGQIKKNLPVYFEEMPLSEARKIGATGVFDSKYGEKVKVYFVGKGSENFSKEICGGPHVDSTRELGEFKIIKEESSSKGVRRIKAILQ